MAGMVVNELAVRAGASLGPHREWRGTRRRIDRHEPRVASDHRGPASRLSPGGRVLARESGAVAIGWLDVGPGFRTEWSAARGWLSWSPVAPGKRRSDPRAGVIGGSTGGDPEGAPTLRL